MYCLSFDTYSFSSYSWSETHATVVESFYGFDNQSQEQHLFFRYQYTVHNITYTSSQIAPNSYSSSIDKTDPVFNVTLLLTRYPVNSTIQVYYNPSNPSQVVVYRGLSSYDYIILSQVIFVLSIFVCSALTSKSNLSKDCDSSNSFIDKFLFVFPYFILLVAVGDITFILLLGALIVAPEIIIFPVLPFLFIETIFISFNTSFQYGFFHISTLITIIIEIIAIRILMHRFKITSYEKFGYVVQDKTIQYNETTKNWILTIHGNYYKSKETIIPFEFTCPKKFRSEASALKFFTKHLNSRIPSNNNKYCMYIPKENTASNAKHMIFGYEVYSKYFPNYVLMWVPFFLDFNILFNLLYSIPSLYTGLSKNSKFAHIFSIPLLYKTGLVTLQRVFSLNFTLNELFFTIEIVALVILICIQLILAGKGLKRSVKIFLRESYFHLLRNLS